MRVGNRENPTSIPPRWQLKSYINEKTADYIDRKLQLYFEAGAKEVWVLFPNQEHLWIYRPGGTTQVFSGSFSSELLAGQNIDLAEILK